MYLNELQLDALREVSNIGCGNAATALASMIGRPIDLRVPVAAAMPLADAVDAVGNPEDEVSAVVIPVVGSLQATVVLLFQPEAHDTLCGLLGVSGDREMELSCLGEIGNILGASYVGAMGVLLGMELEPMPPATLNDMLGAVVASTFATIAEESDTTLFLDSQLVIEGESCSFGFVFVPSATGISDLLERLGLEGSER